MEDYKTRVDKSYISPTKLLFQLYTSKVINNLACNFENLINDLYRPWVSASKEFNTFLTTTCANST